MGSNKSDGFAYDLESPEVIVNVNDFEIASTPVTNQEFQKFVNATGYITDAEHNNKSFVFRDSISQEIKEISNIVEGLPWWYEVIGANWKQPFGPNSSIEDLLDHPVVHVSRKDAIEYCKWAGLRLPTEAEWEFAARGGLEKKPYPWGDELYINGERNCNIWNGEFPEWDNKKELPQVKPVKSYTPNGYGLYQMSGNVWEWCLNRRWVELKDFNDNNYLNTLFSDVYKNIENAQYAIRGGSFLCHDNYCRRYKVHGRNGNIANSTSNNLSFRCVKN
ncbi:sulfatase-modifying factor 1 [Spiroplasma culicicola AES-1]|uniref:Sulfatase-modifying factor 1 n=2 Tax=Spiroplasma culicicola TaxID=216935 RepID=W6A739_9MOLU|nr:sulfatase-modifying factor 1 [Spiroplasma culicicola AES-1]